MVGREQTAINRVTKNSYLALGVVFALIIQIKLTQILREIDIAYVPLPDAEAQEWNPVLFKTLTFGYLAAGIDWLWINVLQDDALTKALSREHPPMYYQLKLMAELDPANFDVYYYGAHLLTIVRKDPHGAIALLEQGERFRTSKLPGYPVEFIEKYWNRPWVIPLIMGYLYWFELSDIPKASEAFIEASRHQGSPQYLQSLQNRLQTPEGQYQTGLRLLNHLVQSAESPSFKDEYRKKAKDLSIGHFLYQLNQEFREYAALHAERADPQKLFEQFLAKNNMLAQDPYGGALYRDETTGKILSRTPRDTTFGMEF